MLRLEFIKFAGRNQKDYCRCCMLSKNFEAVRAVIIASAEPVSIRGMSVIISECWGAGAGASRAEYTLVIFELIRSGVHKTPNAENSLVATFVRQ